MMMRKEEILKKIGSIIDDLKDQQLYLTDSKDYNVLELELFTANADFLIDHIEILKKLQESKYLTNKVAEIEAAKPVIPIIETIIIPEVEFLEPTTFPKKVLNGFDFTEKPTEIRFDFEQNIPVENFFDRELTAQETEVLQTKQNFFSKLNEVNHTQSQENVIQVSPIAEPLIPQNQQPEIIIAHKLVEEEVAIPNEIVEPQPQPQPQPQSQPHPQSQPEVLADALENKKQTLNEFLSNQTNAQNISSRLSNLATNDLKSAISLNDKMIFIKELFQGYNLAYSEAIEILNRFDSFESADNFLQKNYAVKNKWVDKQDVVDRFYEILNRRYVK